jgi:hypothetical protein
VEQNQTWGGMEEQRKEREEKLKSSDGSKLRARFYRQRFGPLPDFLEARDD